MIKQFQYRSGLLFADLENQALRLFYVERGDVDMRKTGADLDYVVAKPHLFAFFVKYNTVFVEDRRLSVDNCFRLGQFALVRDALSHAAYSRLKVVNRKRV